MIPLLLVGTIMSILCKIASEEVSVQELNFTSGAISGIMKDINLDNREISVGDLNITNTVDKAPVDGEALDDGVDNMVVLEGKGSIQRLDLQKHDDTRAHLELAFPRVVDLSTNQSLLPDESGYLRIANIEVHKVQSEGRYVLKVIEHPGMYRIAKEQPGRLHGDGNKESMNTVITPVIGNDNHNVDYMPPQVDNAENYRKETRGKNIRVSNALDSGRNNVGVLAEDQRSFDTYNVLVQPQNTLKQEATISERNSQNSVGEIKTGELAKSLQKDFEIENGLANDLAGLLKNAVRVNNSQFASWTEWSVWSVCTPLCGKDSRRWSSRERFCVAYDSQLCEGDRIGRMQCADKACSDSIVPVWLLLLGLIMSILVVIISIFCYIIRKQVKGEDVEKDYDTQL